ncbi:MAG: carbohydrate kinase family protein [Phycisphaerales bacterium]|nr:carbohydrate kinase family protein [Phycisphaerales bacterium]
MDIVGLGDPIVDLLINVPHMPKADSSVVAREVFHQGGGKVATAMVAAARLGAKAGMLAWVGGDFTGDFLLKDFQYNGVDTSRIVHGEPGTEGNYCIPLSEEKHGTRMFIIRKLDARRLTADELDYNYIASARCLHLENGFAASVAAAKFAKENGVTVSIDGDGYHPEMEDILPYIDIFIGSEFYHHARFGEMDYRKSCEEIRKVGPRTCWFTLGKQGCVGLADEEFHEVSAYLVDAVDTTGAGDVFHGAYLTAMLEGQNAANCARFACATSAIKCMYVGGRTGIPNRKTLDTFINSGKIDRTELEQRLAYYRRSF